MQRLQSTASLGPEKSVLRRAQERDLPLLIELEQKCFSQDFQDSPTAIRHSIRSPHQEVWIVWHGNDLAGSLSLRLYKFSLRIYSIAVNPSIRGQGIGSELMHLAERRTLLLGKSRLILEVNATDETTIRWYENKGFKKSRHIAGYYAAGIDAWKMTKSIS